LLPNSENKSTDTKANSFIRNVIKYDITSLSGISVMHSIQTTNKRMLGNAICHNK